MTNSRDEQEFWDATFRSAFSRHVCVKDAANQADEALRRRRGETAAPEPSLYAVAANGHISSKLFWTEGEAYVERMRMESGHVNVRGIYQVLKLALAPRATEHQRPDTEPK